MATRGELKTRIADEMKRVDIDVAIERAIASAIQHFKDEGFSEAERTTTDSTVVNQQDYSLPSDFSRNHNWLVTYSGNRVPLIVTDVNTMDLWDTNQNSQTTGYPLYVALWGEGHSNGKYKLYPVPDGVYTITNRYISNMAAPATDTETNNFWMTEGEQMVRQYAKSILFSDVMRQYDFAQAERDLASLEFNRIKARTEGRHYQVDVQPWL
tara:strand:- start:197 stop:829 length:633 start_codon:yes stop_codon:yes gene_type:complete